MIKTFYCLDIKFNTSFGSEEFYHTHLFLSTKKIELRIYYNPDTQLDFKFMTWLDSYDDWDKIDSYTESKISKKEEELLGVNLKSSNVISVSSGTLEDNGNCYFTLILDKIIVYKPIIKGYSNTARVYLNKQGFEWVKNYYSVLSGFGDGNFNIRRMKSMESFYKLGNSEFRPEFEFSSSDNRNNTKPIIEKIPIIKFNLKESSYEEEVINYIDISCKIASFYLRVKIDYDFAVINLEKERVLIYNTLKSKFVNKISSLNRFLSVRGVDGFLKLNWSENYLDNQSKIEKTISNFVQARLLDESSKFLLLYNILEVCMKDYKQDFEKFKIIVVDSEKSKIYNDAFDIIKKTVGLKDQNEFKLKWGNVQNKLIYKPMKSPLNEFLMEKKIPVDELTISISKIKEMRDSLIHGSVDSIKYDELVNSNNQLYKIGVVLILDILGINNWKYNT